MLVHTVHYKSIRIRLSMKASFKLLADNYLSYMLRKLKGQLKNPHISSKYNHQK